MRWLVLNEHAVSRLQESGFEQNAIAANEKSVDATKSHSFDDKGEPQSKAKGSFP